MGCQSNRGQSDPTKIQKPVVLFVLGGPGAGKGTQCEKMIAKFGFKHLSTGDLLRAERKSGSKDAELIESYISQGKLVPSELLVNLVKKEVEKEPKGKYLLDGFPRNQENIDVWNKIMADHTDVKFMLYFECSLETMEKRLLGRAQTSGRSDDNPETIKKRFDTFQSETEPIIKHFEKLNKIQKISAEAEVDEVFASVEKIIVEHGLDK